MEISIRRAPTRQGREEEWNPTLTGIFRRRALSPTTCQEEVPKDLKYHQGPPPPPPGQTLSSTPSSSISPPSSGTIKFCARCMKPGHWSEICTNPPTSQPFTKKPLFCSYCKDNHKGG